MASISDFADISRLFPERATPSAVGSRKRRSATKNNAPWLYSQGEVLDVPNEMWGFKNSSSLAHPGVYWHQTELAALLVQGTDWSRIDARHISKFFRLDPNDSNNLTKPTGFGRKPDKIPIDLFDVYRPSVRGKLDAWDMRTMQAQLTEYSGDPNGD